MWLNASKKLSYLEIFDMNMKFFFPVRIPNEIVSTSKMGSRKYDICFMH